MKNHFAGTKFLEVCQVASRMFYHEMRFPPEPDGYGRQFLIRYAVGRDKASIHYVKLDIAGETFGLPYHAAESFRPAGKDSWDYPNYPGHSVIVGGAHTNCQMRDCLVTHTSSLSKGHTSNVILRNEVAKNLWVWFTLKDWQYTDSLRCSQTLRYA